MEASWVHVTRNTLISLAEASSLAISFLQPACHGKMLKAHAVFCQAYSFRPQAGSTATIRSAGDPKSESMHARNAPSAAGIGTLAP